MRHRPGVLAKRALISSAVGSVDPDCARERNRARRSEHGEGARVRADHHEHVAVFSERIDAVSRTTRRISR